MPTPALSAAARLTTLANPVGSGRPSTAASPALRARTSPASSPASQANFPSLLAEQLGISDSLASAAGLPSAGLPSAATSIDPLAALFGSGQTSAGASPFASPQISQALANAQKALAATTSAASSVSAALTSKGQKAISWAKSMAGRQEWNNLCERFVEEAFGTRGVYPSAKDAAKQLVTHKGSSSLKSAPVGALLYFSADETNGGNGHAAIYLGKGEMISARPDGVKVERVDDPYNAARYVGWGSPPTKFPGRKNIASAVPVSRPPSAATLTAPTSSASAGASVSARSAPVSVSSPPTPRLVPAPPILRPPLPAASSRR